MSRDIPVPQGADVRLVLQGSLHFVIVAPAPLKADPAMFRKPGVHGVFTFDPGLTWPNRDGCRAAAGYLRAGLPIAFCFEALGDALVCRKRLAAGAAE